MDREHAKADKGKAAAKGTTGKTDKKLHGKAKLDKRGLPENSNLKIAEEEKKQWETSAGRT
jgi:hypothetical protein